MDVAGGDPWRKWKAQATRDNLPLLPGATEAPPEAKSLSQNSTPLPSLAEFRAELRKSGKAKVGEQAAVSTPTPSSSAQDPSIVATA